MALCTVGRHTRTGIRLVLMFEPLGSRTGRYSYTEQDPRRTSYEAILFVVGFCGSQRMGLVLRVSYQRSVLRPLMSDEILTFNYRSTDHRKARLLLSCMRNLVRTLLYCHPLLPHFS